MSTPRVGSNISRMRLPASSHLPMASFCWLPPENAPAGVWSARGATSTWSSTRATAAVSARVSIRPARANRSITGSETLLRPSSLRNRPSVLRSSGTRLMPTSSRMASRGEASVTRRPSTRISPRRSGAMPKQARKSCSWPMPCRPAIPRISPGRRTKLASLRRPSVAMPRAWRTGGPVAGAAGRGGKVAASERPMIIRTTSSSLTEPTSAVPTSLPFLSTVSRSQKRRTSASRCEMKTIVTPSSARRSISPPSQSISRPERAEVGSSSKRTPGFLNTARAISTFWRTGSSRSRISARGSTSSSPSDARCSATSRSPTLRRSCPKGPAGARGRSMFWVTVRSRTSVISWNAVCTPCRWASRGRASRTRSPVSSIVPESGCTRPESSFTVVDLPAPFSPSSACTSPARTANEAPSSATVAPKALTTPSTRNASPLAAMASSGRWGGREPSPAPRRLLLGLAHQGGLEADLGRLGRVDRGEPAGVRDDGRLEDVAAGLHLRPGALLAELDLVVGVERQRQGRELRHVLALELRDRVLQRERARVGRRGVGDAGIAHRLVDAVRTLQAVRAAEHLDAVAVRALAGAGLLVLVRDPRLLLHGGGGEAAHLHPQAVDLGPGVGGDDLRELGAGNRLAPHADALGDDLDAGVLGEHLLGGGRARGVDRGPRDAGDDHDVALAAELVDQPLPGLPPGLVLVDGRVVGAGLGDDRVVGEDQRALGAGGLDHLVERRGRDRVDDDGLGTGLDHRVDLLDLALRVRARDLDLQVDLVGHVLRRRHGLDHVGRLGLPVVADVAHRQEDLVLAGRLGAARRAGDPGRAAHGEQRRWQPACQPHGSPQS